MDAPYIPPHPGAPPQPQQAYQAQGHTIPAHPGAPSQPQQAYPVAGHVIPPHPGSPPQPQPHSQFQPTSPQNVIPPHPGVPPTLLPPQDDPYSHIRSLPIFQLSTPADLERLAKAHVQLQKIRQDVAHDYMAPVAYGANGISTKMRTGTISHAVLTRWATPKGFVGKPEDGGEDEGGIIVDVLEHRGKYTWMGNAMHVRLSRDATVLVREKYHIRLKEGKTWVKASRKTCESVKLQLGNKKKGDMVELGMVGRWERWQSVEERTSMLARFEKEYVMPKMPE
ncbi:hypothetical protein BCR34DRAFT_592257 [Clohesyomyces aquaticus]|uniref:Uncharacterized protein n=1 Tax=Clohesyomyces aquaticus TaxID=1231657 RepID=A0A1Y1YUL4_9PLEO|nr:hypothetical protein BCR34DRAFT_592257 [Clohesyomyces aquaticus]